jgi:60 kDa SS-A/Ro ribonucleoprotein
VPAPHNRRNTNQKEKKVMADILASITTRSTPQGQKARQDQVKNTASGYVFEIGDEARFHRFLTLGTDGNTYYTSAAELTRQNAEVVFRMAANKPDEMIADILAVSEAGRAPKNKQAIFALAVAASADATETRQKALAVMHRVCRTGTMLFQFNKYVEQFRGRGPSLNRAIGNWYKLKPVDRLAYQVTKYRAREDWSHRDLLRLVKGYAGKTGEISADRNALLGWVARGVIPFVSVEEGGVVAIDGELAIMADYLDAKDATTAKAWVEIINRGHGMTWEMLPDEALKSPEVWEALLAQGVPQTALMRQLPRLTNVFGGTGQWIAAVADQLMDSEKLKAGRVHPINVLIAQRTYASGHGFRGKSTWTPLRHLTDALDTAFYNAFGAVEPTNKRLLLALDVSGSMTSTIGDLSISCREASAALALVTLATEAPGTTEVVGFTGGYGGGYTRYGRSNLVVPPMRGPIDRLDISARRRLDDVISYIDALPFGSTDCSLPMIWAQKHHLDFDGIVVLTDNETWAGSVHPFQALKSYRQHVGHDVKEVVVGMTATNFSIADPTDPGSLDVAGFDAAVPNLISDFVADRL